MDIEKLKFIIDYDLGNEFLDRMYFIQSIR